MHVNPTNYFEFAKHVSNWQLENNEENKGEITITNENLLVVGYRIGKVQLVCVFVVGRISWVIDVGSWYGHCW